MPPFLVADYISIFCRLLLDQTQPQWSPQAYTCHLATAAGGLTAILVLVFLVDAGPLHYRPSSSIGGSSSNSTGLSTNSAAAAAGGLDPSRPFLDPHHQPTAAPGSSQQQQQQQQQGYVYVPPGEP
jgi:hypothetical protein